MNFSFVFPSRQRPDLLYRLLDSIKNNSRDIMNVEVLVAIDEDDQSDYNYAQLTPERFPFVKVFRVKRSLNFSIDYYTFLAKQSTGKYIITANDDCVLETPDWDTMSMEVLKDKPGVIYGWIEDGLAGWRAKGHGDYCCFPLQGRQGFEALGYIFPSRVPTWGADIWAKALYDQVGSVVSLPFTLRHYCVHNGTRESDEIHRHIAANQVIYDIAPRYEEVNLLLAALRKSLEVSNANS